MKTTLFATALLTLGAIALAPGANAETCHAASVSTTAGILACVSSSGSTSGSGGSDTLTASAEGEGMGTSGTVDLLFTTDAPATGTSTFTSVAHCDATILGLPSNPTVQYPLWKCAPFGGSLTFTASAGTCGTVRGVATTYLAGVAITTTSEDHAVTC